MGASNELPESEELDALYDRFLLRRIVQQVHAGLPTRLCSCPHGGRRRATCLARAACTVNPPVQGARRMQGLLGQPSMHIK